ncbi:PIG-L family deacetylase [bacterium]|nr:PIG-L family deacetylase [bacterium]
MSIKNSFLKNVYSRIINRIFNPFFGINLKPMPFCLNDNDKCLVLAPHPDDESIGMGGVLNLYPHNFDVVCLTSPSKERILEFEEAMKFAGIKNFKMLDLEDKHIINGFEKFKNIDVSLFDYIFIPYIFDQHKDHKAVSLLLKRLLKKSEHKNTLKIVYYEVWSAMSLPNYFVDISSVSSKKAEMINFHKSQIATKDYAQKILGLNSYRGLLRSLDYVEAFSVMTKNEFFKVVDALEFGD